jgi:hypothetical protein
MDSYITLNVPDNQLYYYLIAAYDSFGKTDLNISSQSSSTPLTVDTVSWTKSGIEFSVGTLNQLVWTSGTILKNASQSYSIISGNATWSSGTLYVYFDPIVSITELQTTTSLAIAVASGNYPLATYTGGSSQNIKGGDGSAFISGSQIIAGTIGASALVAGDVIISNTAQIANAVIENTNIKDGTITDAKIGNVIQSTNYSNVTKTGWKIDKTGTITSYGGIEMYTQGTANERLEIKGDVIKVFDANGILRVKLGNLSAL